MLSFMIKALVLFYSHKFVVSYLINFNMIFQKKNVCIHNQVNLKSSECFTNNNNKILLTIAVIFMVT